MTNSTFMGDLKTRSYLRSGSFIVSAEWKAPDLCNSTNYMEQEVLKWDKSRSIWLLLAGWASEIKTTVWIAGKNLLPGTPNFQPHYAYSILYSAATGILLNTKCGHIISLLKVLWWPPIAPRE